MPVAPYCAPADVQAMEKALVLGAGQNPTLDDVTTYIEITQPDIDLILLRAGIDAPVDFTVITAPVTQALLRRVNAQGALSMTVQAAPTFPADRRAQIAKEYAAALKNLAAVVPRLDIAADPGDTQPRGPGVTATPLATGRNAPYFRRYDFRTFGGPFGRDID